MQYCRLHSLFLMIGAIFSISVANASTPEVRQKKRSQIDWNQISVDAVRQEEVSTNQPQIDVADSSLVRVSDTYSQPQHESTQWFANYLPHVCIAIGTTLAGTLLWRKLLAPTKTPDLEMLIASSRADTSEPIGLLWRILRAAHVAGISVNSDGTFVNWQSVDAAQKALYFAELKRLVPN